MSNLSSDLKQNKTLLEQAKKNDDRTKKTLKLRQLVEQCLKTWF